MISAMAKDGPSEALTLVGYTNGDLYISANADQQSPQWTKLDDERRPSLPDLMVTALAISPCNPQEFYVGFAGRKYPNKLWKTTNRGQTFEQLAFHYAEIRSISINPGDCGRLYLVVENGVAVSTDGGSSWSLDPVVDPLLNPPFSAGSRLSAVAWHKRHPRTVVVGGTRGEIFLSFNVERPNSWIRVDDGPSYGDNAKLPDRIVNRIELTRHIPPQFNVALGEISDVASDNLWQGTLGSMGVHWTNLQSPALPATCYFGLYSNPFQTSVHYAAYPYAAAISTQDDVYPYIWSTKKSPQ
jgi:hypothetical protein